MCLDKLRLGKGARGIVTVVVDELRHAGRNVSLLVVAESKVRRLGRTIRGAPSRRTKQCNEEETFKT